VYFEPEAEFSTQCVCDEAAGFVWSENLGSCINCDSYRDTEEYISPMEAACANVPKCVYDVNDPVMNTYGYSTDVYHSTGEYNTVCESIGIEQAFPYASFGDVDYYDGLNMGGLFSGNKYFCLTPVEYVAIREMDTVFGEFQPAHFAEYAGINFPECNFMFAASSSSSSSSTSSSTSSSSTGGSGSGSS